MTANVRVVEAADFGESAAEALLAVVGSMRSPAVGLPTGNTPGPLYEALRRRVEAGDLDVSAWRPIAIDEYGGPREHPCSNRAYFAHSWDVIPGARPVLQFEPEAADREADCRRMAAAVAAAGGLDVAVLGIGKNGHLAFNEPGSPPDSSARVVDLHPASRESARQCWGDDAPIWGLTLGLRELLSARFLLLLASGATKADVVRRAIEGPITPEVPASLIRTAGRHLFLLDAAAAENLTQR